MRIPTGGMLPAGADAVVMVEHTARDARRRRSRSSAPRPPRSTSCERGEDAKKGSRIFARGHRVRPADVGALSGIGLSRVRVVRRPRVAVIATGDEIVPPDVTPRPGPGTERQPVRASRAHQRAAGGEPVDFGVLPDREAVIARRAAARAPHAPTRC